jgi:predicted RNase H-like HicB family nuclease
LSHPAWSATWRPGRECWCCKLKLRPDTYGRNRSLVIVTLTVEMEQESDGRWIAEVIDLPGVIAYGASEAEAVRLVEALARRVLAERIERGEPIPGDRALPHAQSRGA